MSWRAPTSFEQDLLADTRNRWPEIIPLACLLTLTQRIEPLLLRNARQRFLPDLSAESESHLWFSPLVSSRSSREIVLHQGVVKVLADQLLNSPPDLPSLETAWSFTRLHTRHWTAEDRLERDLRYYALTEQVGRVRAGLTDILRLLAGEEDEHKRIDWSRLVKRALPLIAPEGEVPEEGELLAQYAALALGDAGDWVKMNRGQRLPDWLEGKLPRPVEQASLDVAVHSDPDRGRVLHFLAPGQDSEQLVFPSPLPAPLFIEADGQTGQWHSITIDSRIRIGPDVSRLLLTTIDGRQWELQAEELPEADGEAVETAQPVHLVLSYVKADWEQAEAIAAWLRAQGMSVDLLLEADDVPEPVAQDGDIRVVRLWTQAADRYWRSRPEGWREAVTHGLLLRTEPLEGFDGLEGASFSMLDWSDWQRLTDSPDADKLLDPLRDWLAGGDTATAAEPAEQAESTAEPFEGDRKAEIKALLREIEDPATEPTRRLEIGDRLAELGDPRPGVGVREIEVPVEVEPESAEIEGEGVAAEIEARRYPEEIQKLLDEINDPATEPPRRLEIGDELDRLGDPRPGVGLDENGLPDIDWVEIPAGAFIYQDNETRELPTYYISRYPITNGQYQAFVDAGGYEGHRGLVSKVPKVDVEKNPQALWWRGLKRPKPDMSRWSQSNRPRTNVSWYEALAFCRWISMQLVGDVNAIRIPSEEEWEKAARGDKGWIYPWGNDYRSGYANVNENVGKSVGWYLDQTTAVGLYPQGMSFYHVSDLTGTVWEWCMNKHKQLDQLEADTSGDWRVLCGGSWLHNPINARTNFRIGLEPELHYKDAGFRIVSSLPITVR